MPEVISYNPQLRVVDGCGKPWMIAGEFDDWASDEEVIEAYKQCCFSETIDDLLLAIRQGKLNQYKVKVRSI